MNKIYCPFQSLLSLQSLKKIFLATVIFPLWGLGGLHAQVTVVDSGFCGAGGDTNLTWTLYSDSTLTISGSGDMENYGSTPSNRSPWDSYYMTIRIVVIDSGVTTIGNEAFAGCTRLNPITFPNSLISIGDAAFVNCWRFTSVTIPYSVTSIGHRVFEGCRILTSIHVDSNNQRYSSIDGVVYNKLQDTLILCPQAKPGQVVIPNTVTVIGNSAFYGCENLISVVIPNSVITIGDRAFYACVYLNTVSIPNSVTTIGDLAFFLCNRLTSIIIPNSVITIEYGAFFSCYGLTSVIIPNSVTTIGDWAFADCGITSITIPNSVTSIGDWAFNCYYLTSVICNAIIPPAAGKNIFGYGLNAPIYIPCFTYNCYSNDSGWNQYSNNFIINGNPTADTTFYGAAMCHNASYTDQNFTTPIYQAGNYYTTLANSTNCDSVICLNLTLHPITVPTVLNVPICEGATYHFAGEDLITAGTYYDTLQNANGCDSIIELNLVVHPLPDLTQISDTAEGSYDFHGKLLTASGIYYDTLQTIHGCDSIIELTLTVTSVGIVETPLMASLRVYPNPTTGQLIVEIAGQARNDEIDVEITDIVGKTLLSLPSLPSLQAPSLLERAGGEVVIDISHLANGIYFLKVNNQIIKIIKY